MTDGAGMVVRRYGRRLVAGVCLTAIAASFSACGIAGGTHSDTTTAGTYTIPMTSVSQVLLDYLIPTDGNQATIGYETVTNFETAYSLKAEDACLAKDGFPSAPREPAAIGMADIGPPNLAYIRAHPVFDVGLVHFPDATKGMSKAEKRAYKRAVKRCTPKVDVVLGGKEAQRIWNVWQFGVMPAVAKSAAVQAANRRGAVCSQSTAFPATSFDNELNKIYAAANKYYGSAKLSYKQAVKDGNEVERRGTPILLKCFSAAIKTEDRLLAQRAKAFLAKNALVIRQLQETLTKQFEALSAKYDVPLAKAKITTQ